MTDEALRERLCAPGSVVVVGSSGRMGAMLMREGLACGLGMRGIDQPLDYLAPLGRASLVIPCVPAAVFEDVIHIICPAMPESAVLCDITSVKVAPIAQMLNVWQGDVVGSHPLFGPSHGTDEDLDVALVRTKRCSDDGYALAEAFFRALGYRTFDTDAEIHDKAMARIQNMNFITSLAYCAQTANDESLKPFITPSFRRRLAAAKKLLTEDGAMFAGLYEANPYSQQAVRQFSNLLSLASAGEIDLLLARARQWWPENR
ncbi:MAG: prephenate dehydrogenase/arogenate dehydrogenase family protein [Desulfovibrionaceae bacterium]|nr:prephenate dehydrogenase/arogenate dehydrogenase family protein [Desulfovibrionaceae bacterium]